MARLLCSDEAAGPSQAAQANGGFGTHAEHPGRNDCLRWPGHTAGLARGQLRGGHSLPRPVTGTFPSLEQPRAARAGGTRGRRSPWRGSCGGVV